MSVDQVQEFFARVASDPALQQQFNELGQRYAGQKPTPEETDELLERELLPIARAAGFDFTLTDLKAHGNAADGPHGPFPLHDDELAGVAGGGGFCFLIGAGDGMRCSCIFKGSGTGSLGCSGLGW